MGTLVSRRMNGRLTDWNYNPTGSIVNLNVVGDEFRNSG